ncbi:hypothetical protein OUZ56_013021 [Daphnia magna]|uniref:Uncharacterized protein n=1 Tax=Daphnia magna TaxID=35525 RepID=A0ABQ9Z4Q4_9CRUS|nr:hypothetical protein OUZ56_013021 [Daphnia magna]
MFCFVRVFFPSNCTSPSSEIATMGRLDFNQPVGSSYTSQRIRANAAPCGEAEPALYATEGIRELLAAA